MFVFISMTSRHEVDKIVRIPQFKDNDRLQSEERDPILDTLEGIESKFYLSFQRMNDAFRLLSREIHKGTETEEVIEVSTSSEIECSLDHMGLQDTEDLCERDNQKRKNIESSFDRGIDQETIVPTKSSETECSLDHMGLQDTEDLCEMDIQQRKNIESFFERTTRVVKSVKTEHVGRMDIQKPTMVERREIEEKIVQLERMMDRKFHRILNAFQQTIEKAQQQDKM